MPWLEPLLPQFFTTNVWIQRSHGMNVPANPLLKRGRIFFNHPQARRFAEMFFGELGEQTTGRIFRAFPSERAGEKCIPSGKRGDPRNDVRPIFLVNLHSLIFRRRSNTRMDAVDAVGLAASRVNPLSVQWFYDLFFRQMLYGSCTSLRPEVSAKDPSEASNSNNNFVQSKIHLVRDCALLTGLQNHSILPFRTLKLKFSHPAIFCVLHTITNKTADTQSLPIFHPLF